MRRAALDATSFVRGMTEAEFLLDLRAQMACAMCLVIIGESTSRIESGRRSFVVDHPDWPWNQIRGLRNKIVHDYFDLDLSTIWLTMQQSLPGLLSSIAELGELDPRLRSNDEPPQSFS